MFLKAQFLPKSSEQSEVLLDFTRDSYDQKMAAILILFSVRGNGLYAVFYRHDQSLSMFKQIGNRNRKMHMLQC